jgi:hypothetical protein
MYFLLFTKMVEEKVVHPSNICQHTTFHGSTSTGSSFSSTSEV